MSAAALSTSFQLATVWAVSPEAVAKTAPKPEQSKPVRTKADWDEREPLPPISLAFYRKHTESMLRRYLYASMQVGRAPSILADSVGRGWASSRPIRTFEDAVIFVLDVERCLERLSSLDRQMLSRVVDCLADAVPDGSGILWSLLCARLRRYLGAASKADRELSGVHRDTANTRGWHLARSLEIETVGPSLVLTSCDCAVSIPPCHLQLLPAIELVQVNESGYRRKSGSNSIWDGTEVGDQGCEPEAFVGSSGFLEATADLLSLRSSG